jgi:catechol 2,3-dioxygenase
MEKIATIGLTLEALYVHPPHPRRVGHVGCKINEEAHCVRSADAVAEERHMARINKVGHVVLSVKDVEASMKFYAEALGMDVMLHREGNAAFLSFGTQHHDIALFKAPEDAEMGKLGLNHIAFQIEGGETELRQLYGRILQHGAKVDYTTDHGMTHSVYFFDPDGNRLEIFADVMDPEAGRQYMRAGVNLTNRDYKPEPILA